MTDRERVKAVLENDAACDGAFYYGVRSTGVYCRPSCRSKKPRAENLAFFDTPEAAERAGYRPCLRCRPDRPDAAGESAERMKRIIDRGFAEKRQVFSELKKAGADPHRAVRIFRERYGMTPGEYAEELRIGEARRLLAGTDLPVLEAAYSLGFESVPAFYAFFQKHTGETPAAYRKKKKIPVPPPEGGDSCRVYDTEIGRITIAAGRDAVTGLAFGERPELAPAGRTELTDLAFTQLEEYLAGKRREFSVPLSPRGTPFQQRVWNALCAIPYGETRSYRQIAEAVGNPAACRAVGMANNRNPIAILIPCHRVVGADGSLVGYAAGLETKRRLLELERAHGSL